MDFHRSMYSINGFSAMYVLDYVNIYWVLSSAYRRTELSQVEKLLDLQIFSFKVLRIGNFIVCPINTFSSHEMSNYSSFLVQRQRLNAIHWTGMKLCELFWLLEICSALLFSFSGVNFFFFFFFFFSIKMTWGALCDDFPTASMVSLNRIHNCWWVRCGV